MINLYEIEKVGMTRWAREHLKTLRWAYREFYEYANEVNQKDDRLLFINIFEEVWDAILAVKDVEVIFVRVAMNKQIKAECELLRDIQKRFWKQFQANIV